MCLCATQKDATSDLVDVFAYLMEFLSCFPVGAYKVGLNLQVEFEFRTTRTNGVLLGISSQKMDGLGIELVNENVSMELSGLYPIIASHGPVLLKCHADTGAMATICIPNLSKQQHADAALPVQSFQYLRKTSQLSI